MEVRSLVQIKSVTAELVSFFVILALRLEKVMLTTSSSLAQLGKGAGNGPPVLSCTDLPEQEGVRLAVWGPAPLLSLY